MNSLARRSLLLLLALCTSLGCVLGAFSQLAHAEDRFVPGEPPNFGKAGAGGGEFAVPWGAAVQQSTGDIFVADEGNARVQVFTPEGEFLTQVTGAEVPASGAVFKEPTGVAIDNSASVSAGDIYVADLGHDVVDKFMPEGGGYKYVCQMTGVGGGCVKEGGTQSEAFLAPTDVAVDGEGNIYVAELAGPVREFDAEGNYVATLGSDFTSAFSIAVSASGNTIYVVNLLDDVVKMTVEPLSHEVTEEVLDDKGSTAVAVDQATGDVFVDDSEGGSHIDEFESAATNGAKPIAEIGTGEVGAQSFGVAYSTQGAGRLYVTDLTNDDVRIFARETGEPRPELIARPPRTFWRKLLRLPAL